MLQGKGGSAELDASMEGISYEAMQLLLRYMYSADPGRFINSLTIKQVEKVAPLADRFHILPFKDDCDSVLRGVQASDMHGASHACGIHDCQDCMY